MANNNEDRLREIFGEKEITSNLEKSISQPQTFMFGISILLWMLPYVILMIRLYHKVSLSCYIMQIIKDW